MASQPPSGGAILAAMKKISLIQKTFISKINDDAKKGFISDVEKNRYLYGLIENANSTADLPKSENQLFYINGLEKFIADSPDASQPRVSYPHVAQQQYATLVASTQQSEEERRNRETREAVRQQHTESINTPTLSPTNDSTKPESIVAAPATDSDSAKDILRMLQNLSDNMSKTPKNITDMEEKCEHEKSILRQKAIAFQKIVWGTDEDDGYEWDGTYQKTLSIIDQVINDQQQIAFKPNKTKQDLVMESKLDIALARYKKIRDDSTEYKEAQNDKWKTWNADNKLKNRRALAEILKVYHETPVAGYSGPLYVPDPFVSARELMEAFGYSEAIAKRYTSVKLLGAIYMKVSNVFKEKYVEANGSYTRMDIRELRAIYSHIHETNSKQSVIWFEALRQHLFDMTEQEAKGTLSLKKARDDAYESIFPLPKPIGAVNPANSSTPGLLAMGGPKPGGPKKSSKFAAFEGLIGKKPGSLQPPVVSASKVWTPKQLTPEETRLAKEKQEKNRVELLKKTAAAQVKDEEEKRKKAEVEKAEWLVREQLILEQRQRDKASRDTLRSETGSTIDETVQGM